MPRIIALGGDYIQMDAPNYAQWHVDRENRAAFEAWGHDMAAELVADAEIDDTVFEGVRGVTRAIHICRGNAPGGRWLANGGYERIAAEVFPRLTRYDRLLLEYDTPRAGDFGPLRHVRPEATVVLGLLTTKQGELEDAALVEARIREAARQVPLERLALSPQCGFASGEAGNPLTPAQQEAKLRRVGDRRPAGLARGLAARARRVERFYDGWLDEAPRDPFLRAERAPLARGPDRASYGRRPGGASPPARRA